MQLRGGSWPAPQPAWPEPGRTLHPTDFDYAFQPVAAGGLVFFGSSADDSVRALDLETGRQRWQFITRGQVRGLAIAGGRLIASTQKGSILCFAPSPGSDAPTPNAPTTAPAAPAGPGPSESAREILAQIPGSERLQGYVLVVGKPDARLAEALTRGTQFHALCALMDWPRSPMTAGRRS